MKALKSQCNAGMKKLILQIIYPLNERFHHLPVLLPPLTKQPGG